LKEVSGYPEHGARKTSFDPQTGSTVGCWIFGLKPNGIRMTVSNDVLSAAWRPTCATLVAKDYD